jgi:hypothetical protein
MCVLGCFVRNEASMFVLNCKVLQWGFDVCNEGLMRPRNDEHIITPNYCFESLRTAYNSKKPSDLKGERECYSMNHLRWTHIISPQAYHNLITPCR